MTGAIHHLPATGELRNVRSVADRAHSSREVGTSRPASHAPGRVLRMHRCTPPKVVSPAVHADDPSGLAITAQHRLPRTRLFLCFTGAGPRVFLSRPKPVVGGDDQVVRIAAMHRREFLSCKSKQSGRRVVVPVQTPYMVDAPSLITIVDETLGMRINSGKGEMNVANRAHPVDDGLDDLLEVELAMVRLFMRDNVLCARERGVVTQFRRTRGDLEGYRARQRFADHVTRASDVTPYTRQLAADAGFGIVGLADRQENRIVPFPAQGETPDGAA